MVQQKLKAYLAEIIAKVNDLFEGEQLYEALRVSRLASIPNTQQRMSKLFINGPLALAGAMCQNLPHRDR